MVAAHSLLDLSIRDVLAVVPADTGPRSARRGRVAATELTTGRTQGPIPFASVMFRGMGVLDDAIREHLELKREHGAPEEELRRQEEEALGPVRREVVPSEEGEASGDDEALAEMPATATEDTAEPAAETALAPFGGEAPSQQPAPGADEPEAGPGAEEPEPEPFPEEAAPAVPHPAEPVEPLPDPEQREGTAEPEADRLEPPPERSLDAPEESRRFERESYPAEGGPGGDSPAADEDEAAVDGEREGESEEAGDVLEDTPDFLEETPEHDRLWFEQKPPRDFDFD
jgi:hypothetical protein